MVRGDTITNGKNSSIYTVTTLANISNITLKQLIENKAVASDIVDKDFNIEEKLSLLKELVDKINFMEIKIESLVKAKRVKKPIIKKD